MIIVDRIEGDRALLEMEGENIEVPICVLPDETKEGDILTLTPATGDNSATERLRSAVERVELLRTADPGDMEIDL